MKVSLIDYTGFGHADPLYAGKLLVYTKSTRLKQGQATYEDIFGMDDKDILTELAYIANTVRSSWEFVDYTFQIEGVTRAFTHQLVRTRTASFAQQSQRSVDMARFNYLMPTTLNKQQKGWWRNHMHQTAHLYQIYRNANIPAQDCRGLLPTNVKTNIIAKINLRTLADLIGKRKNLRAQSEYGDVAREMEALVLQVHPWTRKFLAPDRTSTPELDRILKGLLGAASPIDKPKLNDALKELDKLKGVWG